MALWQLTTFTVLIGALVIYALIITRRLGLAEARLSRIEEALLDQPRSPTAGLFETPEPLLTPQPSDVSAKAQVSAEEEARRVYLTMRDLRARSGQRADRPSRPAPVAVPEEVEALTATPEATSSSDTIPEPEHAAPIEPVSPPATAELTEDAAATLLESNAAPETNTEPQQNPVDNRPPSDTNANTAETTVADDTNTAAKEKEEALVFLNTRRRRRRARLGY